jgi:hypothetical protein
MSGSEAADISAVIPGQAEGLSPEPMSTMLFKEPSCSPLWRASTS